MIRDLDEVTLSFSLWEQARRDLGAVEERIAQLKLAKTRVTSDELDALDAEHAVLRVRTDRLLGQAIEALRSSRAAGHRGY